MKSKADLLEEKAELERVLTSLSRHPFLNPTQQLLKKLKTDRLEEVNKALETAQ